MKEQLSSSVAMGGTLSVCLLDPEFEDYLRSKLRKTATGGYLELEEEEKSSLIEKVTTSCLSYLNEQKPIALVVSQDIRPFVKMLLALDVNLLPVLSYTELSPRIEVQAIDRISVD